MRSLVVLLTFWPVVVFAQMRCEDLFKVTASQAMVEELARLTLEIESMHDGSAKIALREELLQKSREMSRVLGAEFKTLFTSRIASLREGRANDGEQVRRQDVKETARRLTNPWRERIKHPEWTVEDAPFLNESQVFTIHAKTLAIYDFRARKLEWVSKSSDGVLLDTNKTPKLRLTADQKWLVVTQEKKISIFDVVNREFVTTNVEVNIRHNINGLKTSVDGKYIFVTTSAGELGIFTFPGLKKVEVLQAGSFADENAVHLSPDGKYVFFMTGGTSFALYDLHAGKKVDLPIASINNPVMFQAFFSADSKRLTLTESNGIGYDYHLDQNHFSISNFQANGVFWRRLLSEDSRYMVAIVQSQGRQSQQRIIVYDTITRADVTGELANHTFKTVREPKFINGKLMFVDEVTPTELYMLVYEVGGTGLARYPLGETFKDVISYRLLPDGDSLLLNIRGFHLMEAR